MKEPMDCAMAQAVAETFENLAFMEVLPVPDGTALLPDETSKAALLLHEPLQGEIGLVLPDELLAQLTSTLFSLPPQEQDPAMRRDVLAELLNTIAGRFLNELLPENQLFRIGLPDTEPQPEAQENDEAQVWSFGADGLPFTITLTTL